MAGWATLWLGGIALLAVLLALARARLHRFPVAGRPARRAGARAARGLERRRLATRWSRMARALNDGILSLKDRDFSVSVTRATRDESVNWSPTTTASATGCAWSAKASTSAS